MDAWHELGDLMEQFGTSVFHVGAFVGIVVMVAAFAVEMKWTHAHPPKDRRVEKARELGHIVEAKRAKFWDDAVTPNEQTTSWYHATYVYEISGKQYTYRYRERQYPSTTIKLYYLHSPHRAFHEKKGWSSAHKLLFLLLPIAAGLAVMYLLGGV